MRCVLTSPDPAAEPPAAAADLAERTAQDLRELAGGAVARLPELLEAMAAVGADHDLHRALARIAETAASLTGARHAAIRLRGTDGDPAEDTDGELIAHGTDPGDEQGGAGDRLEVPITFHGERFGGLTLAGKRGSGAPGAAGASPRERFTEEDLHLVRVLATEAGIAMGNARMHAAARQRTRWIDGAASVTTALLAGPEAHATAEDALTVVAEKGRELAEAATGAVLLPHAEGGMEVVAISTELSEAIRTEAYRGRIPERSPVLHQINAGLAVFADDFAADARSVSRLSRHYGPTMLLPLRSNGRVLGALALCRLPGGPRFSHSERTLGTQFAAQAALALVLADRHRDRERLAVYEDRDRIARDLHDLVIQRLFATGMLLESARHKAQVPEVQEGVGRAVDELDATIQEIRTTIIALQQGPPEAPPGLRTRILREAGAAAEVLGSRPSVQFVGPVDARVDEATGRDLLTALHTTLTAKGPGRAEVVVDAATTLTDGRAAVRLTVTRPGTGAAPLVWERPL
ncbi:GAF domain-containing protein [Streptomyces sp. NPDC020742]|uniref:sensor histidine kinase n=1 Tax=Streptomyces sp. NPDC020742 TaxID=3154897 RepID=UPI0033C2C8FD